MPGAMHKGTAVSQPGQRRGRGGTSLTLLEVEVIWCLGRPESHGVHGVVLVPRHWGVIRHGKDNLERTVIPSGYSITSSTVGEPEGVFVLHDATKQGLQAEWRVESTPPAFPDSTLPIGLLWERGICSHDKN